MKNEQKMRIFNYTMIPTVAFLTGIAVAGIYFKPIRFYFRDLNGDGRKDLIFRGGQSFNFYLKQPNGEYRYLEINDFPHEKRDSIEKLLGK